MEYQHIFFCSSRFLSKRSRRLPFKSRSVSHRRIMAPSIPMPAGCSINASVAVKKRDIVKKLLEDRALDNKFSHSFCFVFVSIELRLVSILEIFLHCSQRRSSPAPTLSSPLLPEKLLSESLSLYRKSGEHHITIFSKTIGTKTTRNQCDCLIYMPAGAFGIFRPN